MEKSNAKFMQAKCVRGVPIPTPHLYIANCGPTVGIPLETVAAAFQTFGTVKGVQLADESGTRVVVSYSDATSAQSAKETWDGRACSHLDGRVLHIQYSVPRETHRVEIPIPVFTTTSEIDIPGLYLITDFVSNSEESEILSFVDGRAWQGLLKRRVQHYGYEFMYKVRNVDRSQYLGPLPEFLSPLLKKITSVPEINNLKDALPLDQLTVNEYAPGVGLSPHIDTHSAFEGCIISLSLAGSCIMEFRKYTNEHPTAGDNFSQEQENSNSSLLSDSEKTDCLTQMSYCKRKVVFLPPRSLLIMSREARYAWHHYIPHHKIDIVNGEKKKRSSRRVSLTFRKVRRGPCRCQYKQYCDSRSNP